MGSASSCRSLLRLNSISHNGLRALERLPLGHLRSLSSGPSAGAHKSKITSELWKQRAALAKDATGTEAQQVMVPKCAADSAVSVRYAFGSDTSLKDAYINPFGGPRFGILMEDMDAIAGNVAFKHTDDGNPLTRPPLLVTASVDQISLLRTVPLDDDLLLSAAVVWVGRSSMQIRVILHVEEDDTKPMLESIFTYVARDRATGKSTPLNPFVPKTEAEQARFAAAEAAEQARKAGRKPISAEAAMVAAASDRERAAALLKQAQPHILMPSLSPATSMLIRDTGTSNALLCQPQQRNTAGRIFGGFLMRRAFELAFASAYLHAGARPRFRQVEHVSFTAPVAIGALLRLNAIVILVQPEAPQPLVTVDVEAVVARPEERSSAVSNTFTFTFAVDRADLAKSANGGMLRTTLPASMEEAERQLRVTQLVQEHPIAVL
jgi:acyl-coenzyme A thioesterase 9